MQSSGIWCRDGFTEATRLSPRYPCINNGVYRCGFASTQAAYDEAVASLSEGLERAEGVLERGPFLCGALLVLDARERRT